MNFQIIEEDNLWCGYIDDKFYFGSPDKQLVEQVLREILNENGP